MNKTKLLLASVLVGGMFASAQATVIGINFQGVRPSGTDPANAFSPNFYGLAPTDVAGVIPQANWNNINNGGASGTRNGLKDNTGAITTVGITYDGGDGWHSGDADNSHTDPIGNGDPNAVLLTGTFKQYQNPDADDTMPGEVHALMTFTFFGLVPNGHYNLIEYTVVNKSAAQTYTDIKSTIGITSITSTEQFGAEYNNVFVDASAGGSGNYVKFNDVVADGSGILVLTVLDTNWGNQGCGIPALQLEQVPEPSTLALGLLGGFGLFSMLRRRRA